MMPAKMYTPGLLKTKVVWNEGYDILIFVHDLTNKILSRGSNYIVNVVMRLKLGNSSTSIREFVINSILKGFDQKNRFF